MKTEYDVSDDAWNIYKLLYEDNFPKNFRIIENGRKHIEEIFQNRGSFSSQKILFSGDTDVNFTKGFAHSRLECYKDLIDKGIECKQYKEMYLNNLKILENLTYSVVNVSLIPQSGHLQAVKQGIGNDRIDTFVWCLNEYYEGNSCLLFNHSAYGTQKYLKDYLGLFNNVYDYCKVIYHINESLVDDLKKSGKLAIDTPERMIEFMNLVIRFWRQKYMYLCEKALEYNLDNIQNQLDEVGKKMENLFDFEQVDMG